MATVKSILIVGGSGFIGTHLALKLREGYKVFAGYHRHRVQIPGVTSVPLDVDNRDWIKRVVYMSRPDIIIYAAGDPSMEAAEKNQRDAERLHMNGPANISNVADIFQPRFIYLSSCYTFDGQHGNYHESDTMLPATNLGKSKVGGENFIRGKSLNYVIVRCAQIYGRGNGKNLTFLDRLRMSLDRKQKVEFNAQEYHTYAPIEGLVDLIGKLLDSSIRNRILHYGGLTKMNRIEFGRAFATTFGYDPGLINEKIKEKTTVLDQMTWDFSLNFTQTAELLKIKPLLLEEGFDLIKQKLVSTL